MRAILRRTALAGAATTAAAISLVAGCDTYFFIGDDPVLLGQVCEDGSLDCFATTGTGGTGGAPPGCVPSEENKDVDDTCGVFVSPQGSDEDGQGTKDKPYLTLGMALGKAVSDGKPVYACAAEGAGFDEAVSLTGDATIYGGFDCAEWWYDPTKKPQWTAPADAVPLRVTGQSKVAVYDMVIEARDAEKPGGSAIAVLVAGDKAELTLERCEVNAGAGAAGAPGVTPDTIGPNNEGAAGAAGGNGDDGDGNAGTMANVCTAMNPAVGGAGGQNQCGDINVAGGLGGTGTNDTPGGPGLDGKPAPSGAGMPGSGGQGDDGMGCDPGEAGAKGQSGAAGAGATGIGELTEAGYLGADGQPGQGPGTPGQGGGGGGGAKKCANNNAGPGGGGGGAGGCGGLPGTGGKAGGASIGVVSLNGKAVTLRTVTVTTAKGGEGGNGGNGQPGGAGGNPGLPGGAGACGGGFGGAGGRGGSGGGGLGGHSLGIALKGAPPTLAAVTFNLHAPGVGGLGGDDDMSANGQSGLSCSTLNFDEGAASCEK